jgi:hypothetical protein
VLRSGSPELIAVTARAGLTVDDTNWKYDRLQFSSETIASEEAAKRFEAGRVTLAAAAPTLAVRDSPGGNAYWYTTGVEAKMTAPLRMPSYYFTLDLLQRDSIQAARLDQPLFGPGLPYFPRASDAVLEVLYGLTREQGHRDIQSQLLIELPYAGANIQGLQYVDGEGVVVETAEVVEGSTLGHTLHATWKLDQGDRTVSRASIHLSHAGPTTVRIDAAPYYMSLGMTDSTGGLVDACETFLLPDADDADLRTLPPQAIAEALDHLDSAWRNAFGDWLLIHPQMTAVAGLATPVRDRAGFESQLSYVADILKNARVPDRLLDSKAAHELTTDASLARLKVALARTPMASDTSAEAAAAIEVLQDIRRLRVALQHPEADDLPTAMARLRLPLPGDWPENWERLRHRLVAALTDLRRAVISLVGA